MLNTEDLELVLEFGVVREPVRAVPLSNENNVWVMDYIFQVTCRFATVDKKKKTLLLHSSLYFKYIWL